MNFRKIATLATAGTVAAGMSVLGLGITPALAVDQPISFLVSASGELSIDQTPTAGTALNNGVSAVSMPVTTVTDSRNGTVRLWSVTAYASDLVVGANTILAGQITLDETGTFAVGTIGGFSSGTGTRGAEAPVLGDTPAALVSATGDSIDSVYTYTPTARLAAQGNIPAGAYAGTVTQTVA